jgi:hypothetical protein
LQSYATVAARDAQRRRVQYYLTVIGMGLSVYPVLEGEVPEFDVAAVDGKGLARALPNDNDGSLLAPLLEFISITEEPLADFMDGADLSEAASAPEREWFNPSQGLEVVQHLLSVLRTNPEALPSSGKEREAFVQWVIEDLEGVEQALQLARQRATRFHLAVDY